MYRFYKKIKNSSDNEYGLELVKNGNPFEQPAFLSMLALNMKLRDTNGAISRVLELSGVRLPNGEENIPIEEVPVNFMSLAYSEVSGDRFKKIAAGDNNVEIDEDTRNFVLKYMLPLVSNNGQKRDINECIRNMRNINIMCFCDAIFPIRSMSLVLTEEMQKLNYTEEEIDYILSQVCIFPIGTEAPCINSLISDIKFTTVFMLDIQDSFGITDEKTLQDIFNSNSEVLYLTSNALDLPPEKVCKNSRMLLVHDDGNHDLKSFIHKGKAFPAIVIKFINDVLNNSIINKNNPEAFIPIDIVIDRLELICNDYIEDKKDVSREELIIEVLQNLSYQFGEDLSQGIKKR